MKKEDADYVADAWHTVAARPCEGLRLNGATPLRLVAAAILTMAQACLALLIGRAIFAVLFIWPTIQLPFGAHVYPLGQQSTGRQSRARSLERLSRGASSARTPSCWCATTSCRIGHDKY